jgi:uncharacterized protein YbjQ (UPF0145 family)
MVGTASYNPALGTPPRPVTSELTGEELWNLTQIGYAPLRLLLGSSVCALGFFGGIGATLKSLSRGEVGSVTRLVYDARETALQHVRKEAEDLGADGVIGIKVIVRSLSRSLVEVLAIGTAIRKNPQVQTKSKQLIPQAIIRDRSSFFDLSRAPKRSSGSSDSSEGSSDSGGGGDDGGGGGGDAGGDGGGGGD